MGDTADEVYSNVKDVIRDQSGPVVWIPANEALWLFIWFTICHYTAVVWMHYVQRKRARI